MIRLKILVSVTAALTLAYCSSANFSSGGSSPSQAKPDSKPTSKDAEPIAGPIGKAETQNSAPAGCNMASDYVALSNYPAGVQECIDQGHVYNFYTSQCSQSIVRSTADACTNAKLSETLTSMRFASDDLAQKKAKGYRLISCGSKQEAGARILVVQWWQAGSSTNCNFAESSEVLTKCFTAHDDGHKEPDPTTDAERQARVIKCLTP